MQTDTVDAADPDEWLPDDNGFGGIVVKVGWIIPSLAGPDRFFPFFFVGAEKRVWTTTVSCLVLLSTGIWVGVNCIKGSSLLSYPLQISKTS